MGQHQKRELEMNLKTDSRVELRNGNIVLLKSIIEDDTSGLWDVAIHYPFTGLTEHLTYDCNGYCLEDINYSIERKLK